MPGYHRSHNTLLRNKRDFNQAVMSTNQCGTNAHSTDTRPTLIDSEGHTSSITPVVVMTLVFERNKDENAQSAMKIVCKARFIRSITPVNDAAKRTFCDCLKSSKVATEFRFLLSDAFDEAASSTVSIHDHATPLDTHYSWKLRTLSNNFGSLLKSMTAKLPAKQSDILPTTSGYTHHQRKRVAGHVSIVLLDPSPWEATMSSGDHAALISEGMRSIRAHKA
jgi:hypothetical protein